MTGVGTAELIAAAANAGALGFRDIPQHWKNMHVVRLGGEYTGMSLPLRLGYAWTSQVTPTEYARWTCASPGPGHSVTVGSGMIIMNGIDLDGALEYAWAGGKGQNGGTVSPLPTQEVATESDFKSRAFAAHISAKYHF